MRIIFSPPSENDFKQLFLSSPLRKGGGLDDINIYQPRGIAHRRGSGILSFISGVAKRVLPFIIKAAKPSVKEFGSSVVKDLVHGNRPLRKSLKKHGIKAVKQTGLRLIRGSGRIMKKNKKKKNNKISPGKRKNTPCMKKRKKKSCGYKRDIFEMI